MYDDLSTGVTPFGSDMGRELIASPLSINQTCGFSFRLIPSDPTAIKVGLSHASCTLLTREELHTAQ